jgi:AcrR family transcriptional regulator
MVARRSGQTPLTQEAIVDAALALVDDEGLDALTMRNLGEALGVEASSIYYHVPNQAALHELLVGRVMAGLYESSPPDLDADPVDLLVWANRRYFDALTAHPNVLPLVTERPVRSLEITPGFEMVLGVLYGAGLHPADALTAAGSLGWFVLGAAQSYASQLQHPEHAEDTSRERFGELSSEEFPNIARLLAEPVERTFDQDFEVGLRAFVHGLLG